MAFIDKTIEVAADVHEVYAAWTAFESYPRFMETIETVTVVEDERLHWVALVEDDRMPRSRSTSATRASPGGPSMAARPARSALRSSPPR